MKSIDKIPDLVKDLYRIVTQLETLFPGRKFTPDGHLVGSIGGVLAAHRYGLKLLPASTKDYDAIASDNRLVQVTTTQANSVALRSEPEHLIVLKLARDGAADEVYNGPGALPWRHAGKIQKNGQCSVSLSKLEALMKDKVAMTDRLTVTCS